MRSAAIILAAGGSSRLGQPKQLVAVDGAPLLVRSVRAAFDAGLWPVVVVVGHEADRMRHHLRALPVLIADNPRWSGGMASSVVAGLKTAKSFSASLPGVVIAACDQPRLCPAHFQTLLDTASATRASVVASRYAGRPGVPAWFSCQWFDALGQLAGDEGARSILRHVVASDLAACDFPELEFDIDTPDDLARLAAAVPPDAEMSKRSPDPS